MTDAKQLELFKGVEKEIKKVTKSKKKRSDSKIDDTEWKMLEFKRILNQRPPKSVLKKNPNYGNQYIPLQLIEIMLNCIFKSYEIVAAHPPAFAEGNIIFGINLIVVHPITGERLTYYGTSAVPVTPKGGQIGDVHYHLPAAKSYAIMNAAKHIGQIFRAESDDYTKVFESYFEKKQEKLDPAVERVIQFIDKAKNKTALTKLKKDVDKVKSKAANDAYDKKLKSFTNGK